MKIYLIISFLLCIVSNYYACQCFGSNTIEEDYAAQDFVFVGEVVSIEKVWVKDTLYRYAIEKGLIKARRLDYRDSVLVAKTTLKLLKKFKGDFEDDLVIVYSGFSRDLDCGYEFMVNHKFTVFGSLNPYLEWSENIQNSTTRLTTSSCSFTSEFFGFRQIRKARRNSKIERV